MTICWDLTKYHSDGPAKSRRVESALLSGIIAFIILTLSLQVVAVPQVSDPIQIKYMNALKMMGEENYEQAMQELQQIIQDSPDFTAAHRKLAESYIFTNELEEAQIHFEELLKENIDNPSIHYCLARVDFAKKDYDGAIEKLEKVIEIDPGFVDAYGYPGGL
ncbi:MAG: tetratricopeptide repeat protein, partial [bacterium]